MKKAAYILTVAILAGAIAITTSPHREEVKIFHAGSLTDLLTFLEQEFEREHPEINIAREVSGSVDAIRKVQELNENADLLLVSDYRLLREAGYEYVTFAGNSMVIAYTNRSKYSGEINESNWHEILKRDDVRVGFSNPNSDPCGYRALIVMRLAEDFYGDHSIFDGMVSNNTNIMEDDHVILVPPSERLNPSRKISIRSAEIHLVPLLESGEIDYLFIYKSAAVSRGLRFIDLPPQINLGAIQYRDEYSKIKVVLSDGKVVGGECILYGATIPPGSRNPNGALLFIRMLESNETLRKFGFTPTGFEIPEKWKG